MSKGYKVIGKFSEINTDTLSLKKGDIQFKVNKYMKAAVIVSGVLVLSLIDYNLASAAMPYTPHSAAITGPDLINLKPLQDFISWLTHMLRYLTTLIMGLMSTYSGVLWSMDRKEEAKRVLVNQGVGAFFVFFGYGIVTFIVKKMEAFIQ